MANQHGIWEILNIAVPWRGILTVQVIIFAMAINAVIFTLLLLFLLHRTVISACCTFSIQFDNYEQYAMSLQRLKLTPPPSISPNITLCVQLGS